MTAFSDNAHAITASSLTTALLTLTERNVAAYVWGPPGVGKSQIVRQVADARGVEMIDVRALQFDPVDLRGIPVADGDTTRWLTPSFLPTDGEGILFLDELNAAPPLVQAGLYQLVLDRRLGDYVLPDGWSIVAAGNRETDRAVANRMPSALANRFTHFELVCDVDEWSKWALQSDQPLEIVSFMRYRPELLHVFDAKSNEKRFPTPRAWERVGEIIACELPQDVEYAAIAGTVGDKAAAECCGFLRTFRKLPDPDMILIDPKGQPVPSEDPATLYALASILARRADSKNFEKVWTYAERMPADFTVVTMVDAVTRDTALQETKAFRLFATKYSDLVL